VSRFRQAGVVGAVATLLAACNFAPHFVQPPPAVPEAWPTGPAYAPNAPGVAGLPWRQVFTDPRLQTVIARSLANNQNLAGTVANVEASRAIFRAERSTLLPTFGGSASASVAARTGSARSSSVPLQAGVGISAFTIDLFGRQRNLTRQAFEQYLATDAGYRSARITLIGAVATSYATLASDRDLLAIARQTLNSTATTLALERQLLNAGLASRTDVANVETVYAVARSDVANQTTLIAQDKNALELLVGGQVEDALLPASLSDLDRSVAVVPAGLSSRVLLQRPDVRQAEHVVRANNANIGAARAAFFPDISLTALAGVASRGLVSLFTDPSFALTAAPSLAVPILGGPTRANLDIARADQRAAVAQYRYTVQTAFREVADGLARRGTIVEQRAARAEDVAASTTAYQLLTQQYQAGIGTFLDSLIAQRTAYAARQTQVTTTLTDIDNRVNLYQYIGADDGR